MVEVLIFEKGRWQLKDVKDEQIVYSSTAPTSETAAKWGILLWAKGIDHLLAPGVKIERDKSRDYFYRKYGEPPPGFYENLFFILLDSLLQELKVEEVKKNQFKLSYRNEGVYDYGIDQFDGKYDVGTLVGCIGVETEFFEDGWRIKKGSWWFEFEPY